MVYGPLTMARRHILGDLYKKCDHSQIVPVYMNDADGEVLGHAEEGGGPYADSLTFHMSEENCKLMAGGKFDYSFGTEFSGPERAGGRQQMRRVRLTSILLVLRKGHEPRDGRPTADVVDPPTEVKRKRRPFLF
jgi:hypothetical protein